MIECVPDDRADVVKLPVPPVKDAAPMTVIPSRILTVSPSGGVFVPDATLTVKVTGSE